MITLRLRAVAPVLLCLVAGAARADFEAGERAEAAGDYARALAELVPVADVDVRAALLLAALFDQGRGVRRDAQQALAWRRRAAELGDAQAQYALGRQYLEGRGVPAQPREGALWFERAAQQGHPDARFELGRMLAQGHGVPPDAQQGRALIEQAAEAGSGAARDWLSWPSDASQPSVAQAPAAPARPTDRDEPTPHATLEAAPAVRPGPDITWRWGISRGWGSGPWYYGFDYGVGAGPWGWYPYGWHPYGWYPYGSATQFGFGLSN
jgi:TPR repeat protein